MISETIRFEEVKMTGRKKMKCLRCGKRLVRQKTFSQHINPWNKKSNGELKSYYEIQRELDVDIQKWKEESIDCPKCNQEG